MRPEQGAYRLLLGLMSRVRCTHDPDLVMKNLDFGLFAIARTAVGRHHSCEVWLIGGNRNVVKSRVVVLERCGFSGSDDLGN